MRFLRLFSGPSPEKLEQKGDALAAAGYWGEARLAYERALDKLEKRAGPAGGRQAQLAGKIRQAREALARAHQQTAADLAENNYFQEARELLLLALEISADTRLRAALQAQLHGLAARQETAADAAAPDLLGNLGDQEDEFSPPYPEPAGAVAEAEYFFALCGTLPDEVRDAYLGYGEEFRAGFIALNRGDFAAAARRLDRAMALAPGPQSYIPLELATAHLNLGRLSESRRLLENFIVHHPATLPAYQLLSEIYWEQKEFERADDLLAGLPPELAASEAAVRLKGETLYQAGHLTQAASFNQDVLEAFGWTEAVARELAKVYEALQQPDAARALYAEIIGRCGSCQADSDPEIKHRYAELSFAAGLRGEDLLELYLALVREIPENAAVYYDRISRIYARLDNRVEAARFRAFSARALARRQKR
jgi:thioredoxin-like negative regulator of GroEL